jgi:hypothetical protein
MGVLCVSYAVGADMTITTEEIELLAQTHDLVRFTLGMKTPEHDLTAAALRELAAERDALRARAVKWAGIAGTLIAKRDQLIGALQIVVERSGDMEPKPAWVDGACSLLNRGFLKVDRAALGGKGNAKV